MFRSLAAGNLDVVLGRVLVVVIGVMTHGDRILAAGVLRSLAAGIRDVVLGRVVVVGVFVCVFVTSASTTSSSVSSSVTGAFRSITAAAPKAIEAGPNIRNGKELGRVVVVFGVVEAVVVVVVVVVDVGVVEVFVVAFVFVSMRRSLTAGVFRSITAGNLDVVLGRVVVVFGVVFGVVDVVVR